MAASEVQYRHEYVSGPVRVTSFPASVLAQVANRSETEGNARALVWGDGKVVLDSLNTESGSVGSRSIWSYDGGPLLLEGVDTKSNSFWVQVLTTSPELVPTLAFKEPVSANGAAEESRVSAFFAPGDFAVFTLHPPLIHPVPPRPVSEA